MMNSNILCAIGPNTDSRNDMIEKFFRTYVPQRHSGTLCQIFNRHGSDKGNGWHTYSQFYEYYFEKQRTEITSVFEVGLGTNNTDMRSNMGPSGSPGASLRAWREFFPRATIFGADIDHRILFQEYRLWTFQVDQTNTNSVRSMWNIIGDQKFDLIVDDGLHEPHASEALLSQSIERLSENGLYVIEDVVLYPTNIEKYVGILNRLTTDSILLKLPCEQNTYDNCLALIWG